MKKLIFILTFLFSSCVIFAQTKITAPIVRNSSSDSTYATHYDTLGVGGLQVLYNKTSRNLIPYANRKNGMLVITAVDDSLFQLQGGISNSNWVGLSLSGSSYTAGNGINIAGSVISADTSKLVTTNSTQYITGSKTFSKYVNVLGIEVGITNVAGGSTTAMSNTSTQGWYVASGAPTTTTITLPDATTLSVGQIYTFNNDATGSLVINQYGDGTLYTAPSGGYCEVVLLSNSFSSGQWDVHVWMPKNATFGTSGFSVTGTINSTGLDTYSSNLGSSYTSRTKVDKNYVDSSEGLRVKYSDTASMLSPYQKSYSAVKYTDTSSMLSPYLRSYLGVKYSDTTSMLSGYARTGNLPSLTPYVKYTDTSSMLSPYARTYSVVKYTDTSSMLSGYLRSGNAKNGTVTSIATNTGSGITGGTITTSGTIAADTTVLSTKANVTASILGKVNYSDTSSMLSNYRRKTTLITNSDLTNSTISGVSLGSNLYSLTNGRGITGSSYNGSAAQTWGLDTTQAYTWSALPYYSSLTSGSVLFAGTGGLLTQDNTNLNYNSSSKFLNVGSGGSGGINASSVRCYYFQDPTGGGNYFYFANGAGVTQLVGRLNTSNALFKVVGNSSQTGDLQQWASSSAIVAGVNINGGFYMKGSTSGTITFAVPSTAGTGTYTFPAFVSGSVPNGYGLSTDGSGNLSWTSFLTTSSAASTYLPLSGGTLTGALSGTSATFTGGIQMYNGQAIYARQDQATFTHKIFGTDPTGQQFVFLQSPDNDYNDGIDFRNYSGSSLMRIYHNGNVLIGTTTDNGSLFQVNGAATFASSVKANNVILNNTYSNTWTLESGGGSDFQLLDAGGTSRLAVAYGTSNLTLGTTIGTGTGTLYTGTANIQNTTASSSYTTGALVVSGGVGIAGAVYANSTMNVSGYLTASGGAGTSDIRLKTNIVYNPNLSILDSIDFIQYNMKDNLSRKRYGNIAQQIEKYYPDLVLTNEQGTKAIMYDDLQNLEIHELKERVKALESAIKKLTNK